MLLSAVSVLVVAQSSSEIPEGLMNNPVYRLKICLLSYLAVKMYLSQRGKNIGREFRKERAEENTWA